MDLEIGQARPRSATTSGRRDQNIEPLIPNRLFDSFLKKQRNYKGSEESGIDVGSNPRIEQINEQSLYYVMEGTKKKSFFANFRPRSESDSRKAGVQPRPPAIKSAFEKSEWTQAQNAVGSTFRHRISMEAQSSGKMASDGDKKRSPVTKVVDFFRPRAESSPTRDDSTSNQHRMSSTDEDDSLPMKNPLSKTPPNLYKRVLLSQTPLSKLPLDSRGEPKYSSRIKCSPIINEDDSFEFSSVQKPIAESASSPASQETVYSRFMKAHKCYDLLPTSSKLVTFDIQLSVRKAFFALDYNRVRAAPLWDSEKQVYVGMLTITDFIHILNRLRCYYRVPKIDHRCFGFSTRDGATFRNLESSDDYEQLEQQKISTWMESLENDGQLRSLVCVDPSDSLYAAVETLCHEKVHRLPMMDRRTGNISYILTHKRLINFLFLYIYDLPMPSFMEKTPKELKIGTWGHIETITLSTRLIDALTIFLNKRVSALPLVDSNDKVVDIYVKFDVLNLVAEKAYDDLNITIKEAIAHRSECFEAVHKCFENDNLFTVVKQMVLKALHRLVVVNSEVKVVGVISLSDVLKHLVLEPPTLHDEEKEVNNGES